MNTKSRLYSSLFHAFIPCLLQADKLRILLLLFIISFSFNAVAQICALEIPATTPTNDFTVHNNGTVTHNKTTLMWQVCSQGQTWEASTGGCSGEITKHTWDQALQTPATLNASGGYAGHTDWRLPNIKELGSIVETKCHLPAINTTIFPATPSSAYWSSSPRASNSNNAWLVYFNHGYDNAHPRTKGHYRVRLVRGGQ